MIVPHTTPIAAAAPARPMWVAMMFAYHLGAWKPLGTHDTALSAGRECLRAFQPAWFDIREQALNLRALTEHPAIAKVRAAGIDGKFVARAAHRLCATLEAQDKSLMRLLDEAKPDDRFELSEQVADVLNGLSPEHCIDEDGCIMLTESLLRVLIALHDAPESVIGKLYQILETTPTQLPLVLLALAGDFAYPSRALSIAWHEPLHEFMRKAFRLRASVSALKQEPVGSYLDFCTRTVARSRHAQVIALRLLYRCKPSDMAWHDYLSSLAIEQPDIEEFDDGTIVPFSEFNLDLDTKGIRTSESLAHIFIERQRQPDEHGPNVVMTLMFLDSQLEKAEGPLPQDIADEMFIRSVRNAVLRINQHRRTLISESAIERACNAAREALHDLAKQASIVLQPVDDSSTPAMRRRDNDAMSADLLCATDASVNVGDDGGVRHPTEDKP